MTEQEILRTALEAGFGDARLCRDGDGRPRLLTAYPYLRAKEHGDARISSYYYASQRSYLLLRGLAEKLCAAGLPCRRDDSVPLKPLALAYGLGVQGRNSLVLHPRFGSQMVLGCLLLEAELETPAPAPIRRCEDCGACQRACPSGALKEFAKVDLTRCLRTNMLSGKPYPPQLRPLLGDRLLGCDACQEVCPHNKGLEKPGGDGEPSLYALLAGDKACYQRLKAELGPNTARKNRLLAQALLCAASKKDPGIRPLVEPYLQDKDETVRDHAAWCLQQPKDEPLGGQANTREEKQAGNAARAANPLRASDAAEDRGRA